MQLSDWNLRTTASLVSATCFATILAALTASSIVRADEPAESSSSSALARAVQRTAGEKRLLRYRFEKGQQIRWEVVHESTVQLQDKKFAQTTQNRTTSMKLWTVEDVDADGSATIVNTVEWISLWRKVDDQNAERYDSRKDDNPPLDFVPYAQTIGKALSTKVFSTRGEVVRAVGPNQQDLGAGPVLPPLPEEPIAVGHRWDTPDELQIRLQDKTVKTVKVRYVFTLQAVDEDEAMIGVKTEVLTPIDDPREQAQLVQRQVDGTVAIDLKRGQVSGRRIDWDSRVVGFNGQTGTMAYLARLTETLQDPKSSAKVPAPAPATAKAPVAGPALK